MGFCFFFFSSRRRHTRFKCDWSSDVCSSDLWVTLHENGIRYLEKAPLPYWAMAVSFKLFGIAEWTARLPQGFTVLFLAFLLVSIGRTFLSEDSGFWAAIISIT